MKFVCLMLYAVLLLTLAGCAVEKGARSGPAARVLTLSQATNPDDIIDSMDSTTGWNFYLDKKAKVTLSSVPGHVGQAVKVSYDMMDGGWVAIKKNINKDLSKIRKIRFAVMGEGSENSFEIRFEDINQVNQGYLLKVKSNVGAWKIVEVPMSAFEYWWGPKSDFDWKRVKDLNFAVSKKENDQGGSGKVYIDQVEIIR
ncbi:MAG: CIA30 family protein [Elusimicrobiota bacterium]